MALARLDPGLVIARKSREAGRRTYLFVEDVSLITSKRLEPGYRLLP